MTVLDRLTAAGLARHTAERHLRYCRVRVNGQAVTDPAHLVERADVVVLAATPTTHTEV